MILLLLVRYLLVTIFALQWYFVLSYLVLLILLASREAYARPKLVYPGMAWHVLCAFATGIVAIAAYGFFVVIRLKPWYDPKYVVPLSGMLLGNSINGVSLGLDHFLNAIVLGSGRERTELLLAFGASRREACLPAFRSALRVGLLPTLNSMAVMGLVSIPGGNQDMVNDYTDQSAQEQQGRSLVELRLGRLSATRW